jgi:hypothetical protein
MKISFSWKEAKVFCEAEQRFLLIFLEKEEYYTLNWFIGGKPPNPLGRLRRVMGSQTSSAKQNKRFLLLFLEKEEHS